MLTEIRRRPRCLDLMVSSVRVIYLSLGDPDVSSTSLSFVALERSIGVGAGSSID